MAKVSGIVVGPVYGTIERIFDIPVPILSIIKRLLFASRAIPIQPFIPPVLPGCPGTSCCVSIRPIGFDPTRTLLFPPNIVVTLPEGVIIRIAFLSATYRLEYLSTVPNIGPKKDAT